MCSQQPFGSPVVLQSSCPIMPVLTEQGLEIAGGVAKETTARAVAMRTEMPPQNN